VFDVEKGEKEKKKPSSVTTKKGIASFLSPRGVLSSISLLSLRKGDYALRKERRGGSDRR